MRYCEIGGTGGPAGATGGGTEAVTAGGAGCAGDNPESEDSGVPPETVAETGGAGVTGGTGSARSAGGLLSPVSFGTSQVQRQW